jgi:hypothetical protein
VQLRRHLVVGGDDEHREVRVALGPCAVELRERLVLRQPAVLRLEDDAPTRGPAARVDRDDDVARLARGALDVAHGLAVVPAGRGDLVESFGHELLEVPALRGAALALGAELLALLPLVAQALQLLLELGQPLEELVQRGVLTVARDLDGVQRAGLEVRERVLAVRGGELPEQILAGARHHLRHDLLDPVLDRSRAAIGEVLLERLREVAVLGTEELLDLPVQVLGRRPSALGERDLGLARDLLELRLHEVRVRAGLLAVEDTRADLDGVDDELGRVLPRLLALANEPGGALVLDEQAVDGDAPAERADVGLAEWGCGFHGREVAE